MSELEDLRKKLTLQLSASFPKRAAAFARAEGLGYDAAERELRTRDAQWVESQIWRARLKAEGAKVQPMHRPRKARATKFHF